MLNQTKPVFARRKFLKYSLIGLGGMAALGAVGVGVFNTNQFRDKYDKQ